MSAELLLGVDGGGSRTRVWIVRQELPTEAGVIGRGSGGTANPRVAGIEAATNNLELAISSAFDDAGVQRRPVNVACLALAGADRDAERARVHDWAKGVKLAKRVMITNDALPIIYAADPRGVGIALISGTGSFALGRNHDESTIRCGGWGPVFGDEGSGYAIASDTLRTAVRSADGRGPQTSLLDRVLEHLGIDSASELIPVIYSDQFGRAQISSLAAIAFEAAEDGDAAAFQIVDSAANHLAELVHTVASKLQFSAGDYSLGLSGGVLLNQARFRKRLVDLLADRSCAPAESVLVPEPVAGAVVLAASL